MHRLTLLVGAMFALGACGETQEAQTPQEELLRPAKIATAVSGSGQQIKTFPGITEATQKSVLAFRVSGQIIELPVRSGHEIKQGDLIARLDDALYRNTLTDRKATFELAKTELDRQQTLYEQKHVAKSTLDVARSAFQAAKAALKQAQDDVAYTRLTAPYDGVISRIDVDNFQNVQAQEPIVQFESIDNIDVVFNVPESLFLRINEDNTNGGHVLVRFDALPERIFDAWYREHETLPDASTRSFKVTVTMPRPQDLTVLPGMSVNVEVDLSRVLGGMPGVLVPLEAVFEETGQTWVWKLDDANVAHKTEVTAERIEGEGVLVSEGLGDGDRVIAAGVSFVREGQKIRPLVKERGL